MKVFLAAILVFFSFTKCMGQSWKELNDSLEYYFSNGSYTAALVLGEKAIIAAKKEFGENHSDYATSLNNMASLYLGTTQYAKAEPLFIECIQITKRTLGVKHPDYAGTLNNLAYLYKQIGKYEKAEPLYIECKAIWKETLGPAHEDYAACLHNLADLYFEMGQYLKAETLYIEAMIIWKKELGITHRYYIDNLNNLALLYKEMEQYEKVEPLLKEVIFIRKNLLKSQGTDYATALNILATLYSDLGQYTKAEALYIESMEIWKKSSGTAHPRYATGLNNLGAYYNSTGQYTKAETLFIEAMAINKNDSDITSQAYATNLHNLALLYENTGQYTKAELLCKESLKIKKKSLGSLHPGYAFSLNNLAGVYESMGQYEKAEPIYSESLGILEKALGTAHSRYTTNLNNLALLYMSMGKYEKAEPLILQNNSLELKNLLITFNFLSEKEKVNYLSIKTPLLGTNNSYVFHNKTIAPSILQNNFNQQLFFKSLILADTKILREVVGHSTDTSIQRLFEKWESRKKMLAKQYSLPIAQRRVDVKQIDEEAENLEKELSKKSADFRKQQNSARISMVDIQKKLQQDEVAIEFVRFDLYNKKWTDTTIYAAYIVNKNDSIPHFVPLFEERQLQQLLDDSRKINRTPAKIFYGDGLVAPKGKSTRQGEALSQLVWQPLNPYLTGIKKIYYSPAGKLFSIAFHALPLGNDSLLMEKYQLQQYTSTRQVALQNTENQTVKPINITLFGNANFSMDSIQLTKQRTDISDSYVSRSIYSPSLRGGGFEPWGSLPGTAQEVNSIKQLFDKNKIATRSFAQTAASEENLKALSGNSPQILHIATHGFFLPDLDKTKKDKAVNRGNVYTLAADPLLRTGLILAGGNYAWSGNTPVEGVEDGVVTAYEISQLNLSNTELVVLSACETALGDVKGSEGVFGLQRAFKMAGVKKMIVSLWKIPDRETAELMTSFYTYWMKGKTINDAFTQAQADMRKKYSPFYWAAFVLVE